MTDHIDWSNISSQYDYPLRTFFYRLHHVLHTTTQLLLSVEVTGKFEDLAPQGVVGHWVGNGSKEECFSLLSSHVEYQY
jgi:hypothetical protein